MGLAGNRRLGQPRGVAAGDGPIRAVTRNEASRRRARLRRTPSRSSPGDSPNPNRSSLPGTYRWHSLRRNLGRVGTSSRAAEHSGPQSSDSPVRTDRPWCTRRGNTRGRCRSRRPAAARRCDRRPRHIGRRNRIGQPGSMRLGTEDLAAPGSTCPRCNRLPSDTGTLGLHRMRERRCPPRRRCPTIRSRRMKPSRPRRCPGGRRRSLRSHRPRSRWTHRTMHPPRRPLRLRSHRRPGSMRWSRRPCR